MPRSIAFIIMHSDQATGGSHFILKLLAARGFGALGCANRYAAREAELILENTVLDWAAGVDLPRCGRRLSRKIVGISAIAATATVIAVALSQRGHAARASAARRSAIHPS